MNIQAKRHSLSHILAQAVKSLYGNDVKMAIGPDIEHGFYYDFDFSDVEFKEEHLKELEKKMKQIVKQNQSFEQYSLPFAEAKAYLESINEPYKVEMALDLQERGEALSFYKNVMQNGQITFVDMCIGPHVNNTNQIDPNSFCLDKIAGAYWKGDSSRKMLTRIYGLAFDTPQELQAHITMMEEAKKRDHRVIGKKLDIFSFNENVGLGLPLWHPMGGRIWRVIEDFWIDEHKKAGYEFVRTPHIGNKKLWETSGHWGFYSDSMYPPLEVGQTLEDAKEGKKVSNEDSESYLLKPMNCPFHVEIFKNTPKSYREFPMKWAELGTVYRFEKKGQLGGLTRVRGFTQDDAHLFCRKDQVKEEFSKVVDFIHNIITTFGLEYQAYLSFRDPKGDKYVGSDAMWELAQNTLKEVAQEKGLNAPIEEGEASFYGPKIDFKIKDCIGRQHQCSTVQFDFNLPERFGLTFTNSSGEQEQPLMIHRALLGSFERFIGILIEQFAGLFPLWIAPRQIVIVPVAEKFLDYAYEINALLKQSDLRSEVDASDDTLSKKIRNAETTKVNYILVVGEQEASSQSVTVRSIKTKDQESLSIQEALEKFIQEVMSKAL